MSGDPVISTDAPHCSVTIVNSRGLHARAAAKFVKMATGFDATVGVTRNGQTVSGHSIMGLSRLQWPSLVATISFFAGGLLMVHVFFPLWSWGR